MRPPRTTTRWSGGDDRVGRVHQLWSVQYLRALAAIAVIVFHLLQDIPLMWLGAHGVDLFFVISGLMMVLMTVEREVTPGRFLLDRVTRIVPLYWFATLLTVVGVLAGVRLIAASADPGRLIRSLLFLPSFGERGEIWPTLFLGWTLNFEMFFYLLFAVCLLAPVRWRVAALSGALVVLVALGLLLVPTSAVLRTWTSPLLLEFAAGCWLGEIVGPRNERFALRRTAMLMVGVALALLAASVAAPRLVFGTLSVALVGAGLIVERQGLLPRLTLLKRCGDASYSIYLFQGFAFTAVSASVTVIATSTRLPLDQLRYNAPIGFVAALGLGCAMAIVVERPSTAWLRRRLGHFLRTRVLLALQLRS